MKGFRRRRARRRAFALRPTPLVWRYRPNRISLHARLTPLAALAVALLMLPTTALAWAPTDTTIAPGVSIGGVEVGGLDLTTAAATVRAAWDTPVSVTVRRVTYSRQASKAGQALALNPALDDAWAVGRTGTAPNPTTEVELVVAVNKVRLAAWVKEISGAAYLAPRDARYRLRHQRPVIYAARAGARVDDVVLTRLLRATLQKPGATGTALGAPDDVIEMVEANTKARELPPVLVVDRSARRVTVWSPRRKLGSFPIAVGQPAYPTPLGTFSVVSRQKNPTWTPPNSEWAQDAEPAPPGPNNPLGTRWIGTSATGIGFHGTSNPSSVGTAASHGCMRMYRSDVERMFRMVRIGSPVHILA